MTASQKPATIAAFRISPPPLLTLQDIISAQSKQILLLFSLCIYAKGTDPNTPQPSLRLTEHSTCLAGSQIINSSEINLQNKPRTTLRRTLPRA